MIRFDGSVLRWLLASLLFAFWCTASVWCVLATTLGLRGLIGKAPGPGAFDVFQLQFGLAPTTAFAALFVACLLLMGVVGGLHRWLDPDGHALRAVRWALAAPTLNFAAFLLVALLLVELPEALQNALGWACQLLFVAWPFVVWNGATLVQDRLDDAWWNARWPGKAAFMMALGGLSYQVYGLVLLESPQFGALQPAARVGAEAIVHLLSWLVWLLVALAWIGRLQPEPAMRGLHAMLRWHRLRVQLWQGLLLGTLLLVVVLPVATVALLAIYALPEYEVLARNAGQPLPLPLRIVGWLAQRGAYLSSAGVLLATLYVSLAQARLLVLLGADPGLAQAGDPKESPQASGG